MHASHRRSAQRALADSALSLLAACVAIAMFLPPLADDTSASVLRIVAAAGVIAVAIPLHWIFLGIAVRRMGGMLRGWVALAVLLFPVGGAAALILLAGLLHEPEARPSAAH